jgi:hypothetical protein
VAVVVVVMVGVAVVGIAVVIGAVAAVGWWLETMTRP